MPEVKVPELAESITEGTIAEWLKQVGDSVEKGEAIVELETDKVNVEVVSEEAGVIQEQLANEGDTVEVGQAIAVVGEGSGNADGGSTNDAPKQETSNEIDKSDEESSKQDASSDKDSHQRVNATPSARKYAREKGIDLSEVAPQSNDIVRKSHVDQSQSNNQQTSQPAAKEEPKKHNHKIHLNL